MLDCEVARKQERTDVVLGTTHICRNSFKKIVVMIRRYDNKRACCHCKLCNAGEFA
jgi:hypothetical protein